MTEAADERPDRLKQEDRSGSPAAGAIATWLLIQLIVLALAAAHVPLWYRAPAAVERVAVEQMLVAQVVTSALLFPWLMRNVMTAACVILTSAPFVQLAGMLSETALTPAARAWAYAATWMVALAAWAAALRSQRAQIIGVALGGAVAVGVPLVRYLRSEFFHFPQRQPDALRWFDPVAGALAQLRASPRDSVWWALTIALMVTGLSAAMWSRLRWRATSYPQS